MTIAPKTPPVAGAPRSGSTPHADKVRHSVGNAVQRRVDSASAGLPDGGDWMAERIAPGQPPGKKPPPTRG